jgi:hypothetical protein
MLTLYIYKIKRFFKRKGTEMRDKGKKDKGKREEQKKGKHTLKEKRKQKKDKMKSVLANGR